MKNRKREICTSGSVRDEDGQPPHLLGRRQFLRLGAGAAASPVLSRVARAQSYPSRPVAMVVPFPAGGPTDALARILAEHMRTSLGQPVMIENVSGAGGSIGVGRVARAAPVSCTRVRRRPAMQPMQLFRRANTTGYRRWRPIWSTNR